MHTPDPHAWLGIELRHLAALQAVAEEQSFVRAGRRLGYTQSAISNQIAALERLVGVRLVERARGGSSVTLTTTGQLLYEHSTAIMARLQAARTDVAAARSDQGSVLRVGYFQSVGPIALPRVAGAFRERVPSVRLEFELGDAEHLLQEVVAAGSLDLAFVSAPVRAAGLDSVHLVDDPFVLLSPPGEATADFSTRPLLAYKPCAVQRLHETALEHTHSLPRDRLVWLEDAATIQALVTAGSAYGLLPSLAVTADEPRVEVLEGPRREIHLVWQRDRSTTESLQHFIAAAQSAFRSYATQPCRNAA
ncbi:MAG: LysR family transcriptional regulator [Gaiellaceae bacterium]